MCTLCETLGGAPVDGVDSKNVITPIRYEETPTITTPEDDALYSKVITLAESNEYATRPDYQLFLQFASLSSNFYDLEDQLSDEALDLWENRYEVGLVLAARGFTAAQLSLISMMGERGLQGLMSSSKEA